MFSFKYNLSSKVIALLFLVNQGAFAVDGTDQSLFAYSSDIDFRLPNDCSLHLRGSDGCLQEDSLVETPLFNSPLSFLNVPSSAEEKNSILYGEYQSGGYQKKIDILGTDWPGEFEKNPDWVQYFSSFIKK
jgi:hypothetical protein